MNQSLGRKQPEPEGGIVSSSHTLFATSQNTTVFGAKGGPFPVGCDASVAAATRVVEREAIRNYNTGG